MQHRLHVVRAAPQLDVNRQSRVLHTDLQALVLPMHLLRTDAANQLLPGATDYHAQMQGTDAWCNSCCTPKPTFLGNAPKGTGMLYYSLGILTCSMAYRYYFVHVPLR